jgi:hypothetical protein
MHSVYLCKCVSFIRFIYVNVFHSFSSSLCIVSNVTVSVEIYCYYYFLLFFIISNLRFSWEKLPDYWWNNIPKHERFCNLCNLREIGNKFHYICTCQKVEIVQLRLKYIPSYFVRYSSVQDLTVTRDPL